MAIFFLQPTMTLHRFCFLLLLLATSCSVFKPIPQPKTEFRGVWIATVANIDWPKNGLDGVLKQKKDYLAILDFYEALNFNAVVVQVRTAGDAFYASPYAPWSRFLTGEEGRAPDSQEDLLEWMIAEAHLRGMEFHAWFNPYRATFDLKTERLSPTHDFNLHPEWMLKYGSKYYYDPGLPEVQDRLVSIIDEVVSKYDIDAIHFDDYFYPYKIQDAVFEDQNSFRFHNKINASLEDWRRANIDSLVKKVHQTVKSNKPWVQFGISPFGVWKNKATDPRGSDTQAGQTTYEDLYADPLLWSEMGWLDYLLPQIYWSMDLPVASHRKIMDWWAGHLKKTNLYIGNGVYKIRNNADSVWYDKKELPRQLTLARKTPEVGGNVFFSAKILMQDHSDIVAHLKKKYYRRPALPPVSSLLPNKEKFSPTIVTSASDSLAFKMPEGYRYAMIYDSGRKQKKDYPMKKLKKKISILNATELVLPRSYFSKKKQVAVSFIDFYGRETKPILVHLNQTNHYDPKE
ncbi:MAG: family 10 glycosylhydrolase [Flavobacteriaceae bacterium]